MTRRITDVDRMLAFEDGINRTIDKPIKGRRRTVRKFGQLEVIVVEETGESTQVYLTNGDGVIVEMTASELAEAAATVRELLANPPPMYGRTSHRKKAR
jgi:hypothetical protein